MASAGGLCRTSSSKALLLGPFYTFSLHFCSVLKKIAHWCNFPSTILFRAHYYTGLGDNWQKSAVEVKLESLFPFPPKRPLCLACHADETWSKTGKISGGNGGYPVKTLLERHFWKTGKKDIFTTTCVMRKRRKADVCIGCVFFFFRCETYPRIWELSELHTREETSIKSAYTSSSFRLLGFFPRTWIRRLCFRIKET